MASRFETPTLRKKREGWASLGACSSPATHNLPFPKERETMGQLPLCKSLPLDWLHFSGTYSLPPLRLKSFWV